MKKLEWLGLYSEEERPTWKEGESIYFRHTPYPFDWIVLILMSLLNMVNAIFIDSDDDTMSPSQMTNKCREDIRDTYGQVWYMYIRARNLINQYFIMLVLCISLFFIGKAQTNLINWVFFSLNIIMFGFIAKADNKVGINKWSLFVAKVLSSFSAIVLLADIIFIIVIGEVEKQKQPDSYD